MTHTTKRLFLFAAAFLCASTALAMDLDPALDSANPLAPFAAFLGSAFVTKVLLWMGACRAVGKLVSAKLQELLDAAVQFVRGTADESDDHWLNSILSSRIYQGAQFAVDYLFSIKLPVLPPSAVADAARAQAAPLLLVGSLTAALLLSGCASLAPDGIYKGDKILYTAESTTAGAYEVLHSFVLFELHNREALAGTPEVRRAADNVRLNAEKWIKSATLLRDAYAVNPTEANRSALEQGISVLRAALAEATRYMTAQANPKPAK